ncbi:MAG: DUF262 domain-containing HNH endonuclease family protein [Hyphomicrobiaceae bacterium]
MPIHFATSAVTVSQLFSGSHTYRMPEFQRPYSWPEDRAVQLFDDLESACVASASRASSATEYFLGALIVTQQSPRAPFLIVDGQQRLVTLAAILAILRDHLPQSDFRARLHERIERPADQAADYQKAPRIELRDIDQDEFLRWVVKDGGTVRLPRVPETRSTAKLLDALNQLNNNFPTANEDFIRRLATFILNNCSFVQITANSVDDAYKLFKSVNNPGLPLSDLALARTELLGPSAHDPRLCAQIAGAWDEIEEQIGDDQLRKYVVTVASLVLPGASQRDLFSVVREISRDNRLAGEFNRKLREFLLAYRALDSAEIDFGPDSARINRHIHCLLNTPFEDWRPAALFWLTQGRAAPDSLAFFRALDGLCLALQILSVKAKAVARRFERVMDAIADNSILSRTTSPLYLTESETRSVRERLASPIRKTSYLKNLLLRLNVAVTPTDIPPYFPTEVEIEHVLPQKPGPNGEWGQAFPDAAERERLTHLLGNLTLLTSNKNKKVSNLPFAQKKERIFSLQENNCFALTANLAGHAQWTPDTIQRRQNELLRHASEVMGL